MTEAQQQSAPSKIIAAVDLGSNSFHLILAEISPHHYKILHREKRKVRLAAGLDKQNKLSAAAIHRAIETLTAFGEIIEHSKTQLVRTVGTYTFRTATNINALITQIQTHYPHPIEILSGAEEARLIYQGVYQDAILRERSLIIDIGGGSTELVIGESSDPLIVHSCAMGCVSVTEKFFHNNHISEAQFQRAIIFAEQQLEPLIKRYRKLGWKQVIGTSGSIKSLCQCATAMNLSDGTLTPDVLRQIQHHILQWQNINNINLPGVNPDQLPVICGGLAILVAAFDLLKINDSQYCNAALREGLLFDIQARLDNRDIRHESISTLAKRFEADTDYSVAVMNTCDHLFTSIQHQWKNCTPEHKRLLIWAAQLHEIGLQINYEKAHEHAAYIVSNAILPGFNHQQQSELAFLLKCLRNSTKPDTTPLTTNTATLNQLAALLRIAITLNRCREPTQFAFQVTATALGLNLDFSPEWRSLQCLLEADLQQEQQYCSYSKLTLAWRFL